jgi:hypothetical protein
MNKSEKYLTANTSSKARLYFMLRFFVPAPLQLNSTLNMSTFAGMLTQMKSHIATQNLSIDSRVMRAG